MLNLTFKWLLIQQFSAILCLEQVNFQWDDDEVGFVLNRLSWIFIVLAYWNNSPASRNVAPLGHIILIQSQTVFALSP